MSAEDASLNLHIPQEVRAELIASLRQGGMGELFRPRVYACVNEVFKAGRVMPLAWQSRQASRFAQVGVYNATGREWPAPEAVKAAVIGEVEALRVEFSDAQYRGVVRFS